MKSIYKYITAIALTGVAGLAADAAPKTAAKGGKSMEEIERMIRRGALDEATEALDSAAAVQPKNAQLDYLRGKCLVAGNDDAGAIEAFENAHRKGSNDALLELAEIAVREYRVDDAENNIDDYKAYITKNKRKKLADNSGDIASQLIRTRSMLDRVEKIVVFDSITVDKDAFLDAYRLSPEAGSLNYPDILPEDTDYSDPTVVYCTEDGREMLWGIQNDESIFTLQSMHRLADNTWEKPESVGDHLGQGSDANYPFLMPDGVTLYFASDNEESLGGLDIFVSRNNGTGFLQPQNIGMPYNSPYDDYMLAIDELTGVGFWASDRNRLGDKITIYLFIPSQSRVNVDLDDPTLARRASLRSIRDTWPENADFSKIHQALDNVNENVKKRARQFELSLPDGRVLTRYKQFTSQHAADLMAQYVDLKKATDKAKERLAALRIEYGNGKTGVGPEILTMEADITQAEAQLKRVANDVIRAETGGNVK
ncbi:MAG: hypothetical protein K2L55_05580 [Muribaculaceae bacterium]|nr:hypothetical protein [Muribaculaceae bacterium]